jgi:hypothetical protein
MMGCCRSTIYPKPSNLILKDIKRKKLTGSANYWQQEELDKNSPPTSLLVPSSQRTSLDLEDSTENGFHVESGGEEEELEKIILIRECDIVKFEEKKKIPRTRENPPLNKTPVTRSPNFKKKKIRTESKVQPEFHQESLELIELRPTTETTEFLLILPEKINTDLVQIRENTPLKSAQRTISLNKTVGTKEPEEKERKKNFKKSDTNKPASKKSSLKGHTSRRSATTHTHLVSSKSSQNSKVTVQFPETPSRDKRSEKRIRSYSQGEKRAKQLQGSLLEKGVISTRTVSVKRKKSASKKGSLAQRAMLSSTTGEIETKKHQNI